MSTGVPWVSCQYPPCDSSCDATSRMMRRQSANPCGWCCVVEWSCRVVVCNTGDGTIVHCHQHSNRPIHGRVVGRPEVQHSIALRSLRRPSRYEHLVFSTPASSFIDVQLIGEISDYALVILDVIRHGFALDLCHILGAWTVRLLVVIISLFLLSHPHHSHDHGGDLSWHQRSCHRVALDIKLTCGDP